ncbi:MAG TPA: hypothetical protein VD836_17540 [Solirubrobacteraceae bacterium]|nr:hypothetical protein [Solirubrobacteraceae bacterium]
MVRAAEHAAQAPAAEPVEVEPVRLAGPASALLALQRTAGNRAVVRLLSRQTAPEEAVPTAPERIGDPVPLPERSHVQRGSPQTPTPLPGATPPACPYTLSGPRVPGQQDPDILSIVGPNLLTNGGFDWRVAFELPAPASADGWIIQQRHMNAGPGTGPGNCIWETWKVLANRTAPEGRLSGYDDTYRNANIRPAGPGRSWWQHLGVVAFYPGPLPPEFGPEAAGTHHYMSDTRPASWNGHGQRHNCFSVTQNPPPRGQPAHRLVADDGRNEVEITA